MLNHKISGFYVHDFLQVKRMNKINLCYNELIEEIGFLPRCFPCIGLNSDLEKETSHMKMKAEVYYLEGTPYFLRPTSEAIAYPLTYGDASLKTPFRWYSIGPAFRNESKYCRKYERHKEISFFHESHAIYSTAEKAELQVEALLPLISNFLDEQGLPHVVNIRPIEDTFPGAEKTYAFDTITDKGTVLQILTLHYLGSNFSKAYKQGGQFYGVCFGHSERIIGALNEHYKEDLRWVKNPYPIISHRQLLRCAKERKVSVNRGMYDLLREYNAIAIEKTPGVYFSPNSLETMEGLCYTKDQIQTRILEKESLHKSYSREKFNTRLPLIDPAVYGQRFL